MRVQTRKCIKRYLNALNAWRVSFIWYISFNWVRKASNLLKLWWMLWVDKGLSKSDCIVWGHFQWSFSSIKQAVKRMRLSRNILWKRWNSSSGKIKPQDKEHLWWLKLYFQSGQTKHGKTGHFQGGVINCLKSKCHKPIRAKILLAKCHISKFY